MTPNTDSTGATSEGEEPGSASADADPPARPGASSDPAEPPSAEGDQAVVDVITESPEIDQGLDLAWLRDRIAAAAARLPRPVERVSVSIVGDAGMAVLHRAFADQDGPTDVLAFADQGPAGGVGADIAVNAEEAGRQAARRGHRVEAEILLYVVHGSLHCLGYDDHAPEAFHEMHAEEDRILNAIGVGTTFGDRDGAVKGADG